MAGSYKVPTITIAVIFIIFASVHLIRVCREMNGTHMYGDCGHDKTPTATPSARRVGDMMIMEKKASTGPDEKYEGLHDEHKEFRDKVYSDYQHKYNSVGRIVAIVGDVISILTGILIYAAVNDETPLNVRRRHFILPFIVWHSFFAFMLIVGLLFTMIVYKADLRALAMPLLLTASFILTIILCITMVTKYYLGLSRQTGFSYAQMDDVKEVKKPLA